MIPKTRSIKFTTSVVPPPPGIDFVQEDGLLEIHGIRPELMNAIRATMSSNIPAKILTFDGYFTTDNKCSLETNDPFIIRELVETQIRMLPIPQSIAVGTEFKLHAENNTFETMAVTTDHISGCKFPGKFTIAVLFPQTYLTMGRLKVIEAIPNCYNNGAHISAIRVIMLPITDTQPITEDVKTSSIDKFMIKFRTSGTENASDLLSRTIEVILNHLNNVNPSDIINLGNGKYSLEIPGGVAQIAMAVAHVITLTGSSATHREDIMMKKTTVTFMSADAESVIRKCISELITYYTKIASSI